MVQKRFRLLWNDIPNQLKKEYIGEDIQKLLGTTYKKFYDFEKWVLKPTQKELREHTDLCFDYKKVKHSRYIVGIYIDIRKNIPVSKGDELNINSHDTSEKAKKDDIENLSIEMMQREAFLKVEKLDRPMLCYAFQRKVKDEYGVEFQISMLEGYLTNTINDVFQAIGFWQIQRRTQHSVSKYIRKVLEDKEQIYKLMKQKLGI